jgi:hypothetical protein
MPKGPQGQKRPADVIGNAVRVMRIATGEEEETLPERSAAVELGAKGGAARAKKLSRDRPRAGDRLTAEQRGIPAVVDPRRSRIAPHLHKLDPALTGGAFSRARWPRRLWERGPLRGGTNILDRALLHLSAGPSTSPPRTSRAELSPALTGGAFSFIAPNARLSPM